MIKIRKSSERGLADHGWLKSFHTFSFADYYDPSHMGHGVLRVINEDYIEGGMGFNTHGHRDMEIFTYLISGALEHKDSMGNGTVIKAGEVQRMSAGSGVKHSEFNHYKDKDAHLLQIWILPDNKNLEPSYEQKSFEKELSSQRPVLVASPDRRENSVKIHQNALIYVIKAPTSEGKFTFEFSNFTKGWIQVISGKVEFDLDEKTFLESGDAAALSDVDKVQLNWTSNSHFLLFLLP